METPDDKMKIAGNNKSDQAYKTKFENQKSLGQIW